MAHGKTPDLYFFLQNVYCFLSGGQIFPRKPSTIDSVESKTGPVDTATGYAGNFLNFSQANGDNGPRSSHDVETDHRITERREEATIKKKNYGRAQPVTLSSLKRQLSRHTRGQSINPLRRFFFFGGGEGGKGLVRLFF